MDVSLNFTQVAGRNQRTKIWWADKRYDLCYKVSERACDQKNTSVDMLLKDTKTAKCSHAPRQFACQHRVWSQKLNRQRGLLYDCWIGTKILRNKPRNPTTGGKTESKWKGEVSWQALIFNPKLSMEDCLNTYQNLEYTCSLLLWGKFFFSRWFHGYFTVNFRELMFKVLLSQVMICDP